MKRVGLMALNSRTYNYGGILQEYALYKIIGQLGHEKEVYKAQLILKSPSIYRLLKKIRKPVIPDI